MSATELVLAPLQDRIADAVHRVETLESSYATITVPQLISMRARTHPSNIAIEIFERDERATYEEMDRWSNRYANALRAFGVRKGDRVAVMLPNRIEFPLLWFACAKLGAVLVGINMRYTSREVEYVLGDTQARFAFVDESAWPVVSTIESWPKDLARERVIIVGQPVDGNVATLDRFLETAGDSPVEDEVRPEDVLVIASTSGTTGFPKGVPLTHDSFAMGTYILACMDNQRYNRYLCWNPFFYTWGQWQILGTYWRGATLYAAQRLSSRRFVDWIEKYRIEWCAMPKPIAESIDGVPTCLKGVLRLDGWSVDTIRRFRERYGVHSHGHGYAMTEIGCGTIFFDLPETQDASFVGLRAPFRELRLVNEDGGPAPVGEVGELWVKGRAIFTGYWNQSEANSKLFERDWFKTGDLLRCDANGFYWFAGRKKDMIRRSSENIAAGEVEAIIRELPEIADVAAVPVPDAVRGEEIKICVELKEGLAPADLPVERILEHARARLARFKVPRYIAFIPALPRTVASNKVLKRELAATSEPLAGAYDSEEKRWR
ncbi:class I adenylate-forming enzyme family protein [Bradyrhizobium japonicum]|uniref:class I adenylate-forming enzyme family protein n=1 Tax=Bradyrhizobium japonicum TaxID=375 RepID=UPI00057802B0|nr:class I adenylate-forming enzyme family protein [Bradyrhizobium japonicum]